jgi:hypothetical protein
MLAAAAPGRAESPLRPRVWVDARLGMVGVERPVK